MGTFNDPCFYDAHDFPGPIAIGSGEAYAIRQLMCVRDAMAKVGVTLGVLSTSNAFHGEAVEMGVSINGGVPQNGWFIRGKSY